MAKKQPKTKPSKPGIAGKTTATKPATTTTPTVPAIKDVTDYRNQGIILIRQSAMQDIFKSSGPLAKSNEFQVSYWALVFRHVAADGSILDIAVPTVYFNYKQTVTAAHIDFEHTDAGILSDKLKPLHDAKVNELLATDFQADLERHFGINFSLISVPLNTIHRHPGSSRSQSFSGTDLCKDATEPGVCYPLQQASNDCPNFAGIMAIDSGVCNIAHYEYRIANGKLGEDIKYIKGCCTALVDSPSPKPSIVAQLFGAQPNPDYYIKTKQDIDESYFTPVLEILQSTNFYPDTRAVDPSNVVAQPTRNYYNYGYRSTNGKFQYQTTIFDGELLEAKKLINDCKNVNILDKKALAKLDRYKLLEHLDQLELAYYGKTYPNNETMPVSTLLDEILELQDTLIDEYNEACDMIKASNDNITPTRPVSIIESMKAELRACGTPETMLAGASDHAIKAWHAQLV